jgi:hypothetical protein
MSVPAAWPQVLNFFGTPLVIEPSAGQLSSDAGLLPIRQFDDRVGLTRAFADALDDPRDPDVTEHSFLEMVRARVYGILAGYEDQNDHDTLRADPVFKLVADRSPEDDDLASQPTLSRFENAISIKSLTRVRKAASDPHARSRKRTSSSAPLQSRASRKIALASAFTSFMVRPRSLSSTQCPVCGETRQEMSDRSIGASAVVRTQTGIEPGAGIGPLPLRGPRGKPKGDGGIFQGESGEKTQVHQPGGVRVLHGKLAERFIQCD